MSAAGCHCFHFTVVVFKTLSLPSFSHYQLAFSGGKQHPNILVDLRRPNIGREFFWLSALNLKDIPFNDDFRETLDRAPVKYVLPTGAFMSKIIATFVQKVGLIWLKVAFHFRCSGTDVIVGLILLTTGTNVTTVFCAQGKK